MNHQLGQKSYRGLNNVVTLGSFSLETFHILVDSRSVGQIAALSQQAQNTLAHEFGHLLHYCTSYIGLYDLLYWAKTIDILYHPDLSLANEAAVARQADAILRNARSKQIMSVDDEYYYESNFRLFPRARANRTEWTWRETTGALFQINGQPSDLRFWGLRFYLGRGIENSFARVPVGMRTILEHMAKTIDFFSEVLESNDTAPVTVNFVDESFSPDLLHYYALTHRVASEVRKTYGEENLAWSFLITGELVAILAELPFDEPSVWSRLTQYCHSYLPHQVPYMKVPHLSFCFPIILHAAFSSSVSLNRLLDFSSNMEFVADDILAIVGLPGIASFQLSKKQLATKLISTLQTSEVGKKIADLVRQMNIFSDSITWSKRLLKPVFESSTLPVPVVFPDGNYIEGDVVDIDVVEHLSVLADRRDQMLRYHFTRNIVA